MEEELKPRAITASLAGLATAIMFGVMSSQAAAFSACQVTDTGGVDDKGFNQTAWKGVQDAQASLGVEGKLLESSAETDYEPNINSFISEGCDLILTVGFLLGAVFAKQPENLSRPDRQIDVGIGNDLAKPLGDAA